MFLSSFPIYLVSLLLIFTPALMLKADSIFWPGEEVAAQDLIETMNGQDPGKGWLGKWRKMTQETRDRQPKWLTPMVTSTARLEQRIRYDTYYETLPNGKKAWDFGAGKGVSLIVGPTLQFTFSLPEYLFYPGQGAQDGFGGETFLVRQRIMASPEGQKNYCFSVQLQAVSPYSPFGNTSSTVYNHWTWAPTILFGKGWGNFTIQLNLGTRLTDGNNETKALPYYYNVAFEYRIGYVTPAVEITSQSAFDQLYFINAPGLYVIPEVLIGRFAFKDDWKVYYGFGYQIGLNSPTIEKKYSNALIMKFHLLF
ncbi:hypothetical protein [Methylacidiphilum caldifontis]|uniref:Uncharacterized protein n=1 Tax=Methylacidiphilum caldifontis TaxID=2795386 RepID=A0A4Y8P8R0_9BACT|nr:hypothetical protein [Methylacidiphilum caldifontis]TFE67002.1 hypothetical protein A7Q10_01745 [Methylacidiphilum caldifontis]